MLYTVYNLICQLYLSKSWKRKSYQRQPTKGMRIIEVRFPSAILKSRKKNEYLENVKKKNFEPRIL